MNVKHSSPDSPFVWIAYEGPDLESMPSLPPRDSHRVYRWADRDIDSPAVNVSVAYEGILVKDRDSQQLVRAVRFVPGFPCAGRPESRRSNTPQVVIAADGSVVFLAGLTLYRWRFADGHMQAVATLSEVPEQMVISPAAGRLATLLSPSRNKESEWIAQVWSLPDGKQLADLHWSTVHVGSVTYFAFSRDGSKLVLETEVLALSGSDWAENHTWDIGVGPEAET